MGGQTDSERDTDLRVSKSEEHLQQGEKATRVALEWNTFGQNMRGHTQFFSSFPLFKIQFPWRSYLVSQGGACASAWDNKAFPCDCNNLYL